MSDHYPSTAELAELGYATLACDLHGGGRKISRDMRSALPEVDPRRIGGSGYCMGGLMALEPARTVAALAVRRQLAGVDHLAIAARGWTS